MSGSVTLGGGTSGTAVTLDNSYVSSHLAMFQAMTAETATAGTSVYSVSAAAPLLLIPDNFAQPVAVFGGASSSAVVVGQGSSVDFVSLGSATVAAGDGNNVAIGGAGTDVFALGTGHNSIFLGSGQATVLSAGTDTIQGGIGSTSVVVTGTDSRIYGGNAGTLSVDDTSGQGTTVQAGANTVVDATTISGATTTVLAYGDLTVGGGGGGNTLVNQTYGSFTFLGQGGSLTVNEGTEASAADLYAANGTRITLAGNTQGNVFVANDTTKGAGGSVVLDGSQASGGNQFWAGSGNATLIGGSGNDTLVGGEGASTLTGGAGANQFDFFTVQGGAATTVTITDLNASDTLNLYDYGQAGLQYALSHATQQGSNTVMTLNDGSTITLQNFDQSALATVIKAT